MNDIKQLVELNAFWQHDQLANDQQGFIRGIVVPETFATLLEQGQVVMASQGEIIAGYYLINTVSSGGVLAFQRDKVEDLQRQGKLLLTANYRKLPQKWVLGRRLVCSRSIRGRVFYRGCYSCYFSSWWDNTTTYLLRFLRTMLWALKHILETNGQLWEKIKTDFT